MPWAAQIAVVLPEGCCRTGQKLSNTTYNSFQIRMEEHLYNPPLPSLKSVCKSTVKAIYYSTGCSIIIARSAVVTQMNWSGKNYGTPCTLIFNKVLRPRRLSILHTKSQCIIQIQVPDKGWECVWDLGGERGVRSIWCGGCKQSGNKVYIICMAENYHR